MAESICCDAMHPPMALPTDAPLFALTHVGAQADCPCHPRITSKYDSRTVRLTDYTQKDCQGGAFTNGRSHSNVRSSLQGGALQPAVQTSEPLHSMHSVHSLQNKVNKIYKLFDACKQSQEQRKNRTICKFNDMT